MILADDEGPVHVALTEGMAVRDEEAWRFVCPTVWGSTPDFAVGVGFEGKSWVFGADGRYPILPDGTAEAGGVEVLRATALLDWKVEDRPLALRREFEVREIVDVVSGEPVWTGEGTWNSFVVLDDGTIWLAGVTDDDMLQFLEVDPDGNAGQPVDIEPATYTPRFILDGGQVYLQKRAAGAYALDRVAEDWTLETLAETELFLAGPIDGWILLDKQLQRLDDADTFVDGVTCLSRANGHTYGCVFPALYEIDEVGLSENPVFTLDIEPPDYSLVDEEDRDDCESDWVRMAIDLGLEPFEQEEDELPEVDEPGCGCSPVPASKGAWIPGFIAGLLLLRRRP